MKSVEGLRRPDRICKREYRIRRRRIPSVTSRRQCFFEKLETRLALSCGLAVTNTGDSGFGSLREAILCANATPGIDLVTFNIPGSGQHTIQPLSAFPTVTDAVIIDATTQPSFAGAPLVLATPEKGEPTIAKMYENRDVPLSTRRSLQIPPMPPDKTLDDNKISPNNTAPFVHLPLHLLFHPG